MNPPADSTSHPGLAGPGDSAAHASAAAEIAARVGLTAGERYRCETCGNLTRFDIVVTERSRRFWHPDLGGAGRIEEEDVRTTVESVTCRWCGGEQVAVERVPGADARAPRG